MKSAKILFLNNKAMEQLGAGDLHNFDFDGYADQRMENARYLWENLKGSPACDIVYKDLSDITTGPLFFAIYPKRDASAFCKTSLAPNGIKGVRMWWNQADTNCQSLTGDLSEVFELYQNMVQLPIGVGFGKPEMDRLISAINGQYPYNKKYIHKCGCIFLLYD